MMTSSIISTPTIDLIVEQQQDEYSARCLLQWRQGQLLVRRSQDAKPLYLSALDNDSELVKCLQHSPVQVVRLDPALGEAVLKRWVKACEQANKSVFLWGTVAQRHKGKQSQLSWWHRRVIDAIAALVLLILLTPVMLATALLIYIDSPGAIFSHTWQVGVRGNLFRSLQFRTTEVMDDSCTTPLGHWMCKHSLDKLPQLFNVVRGEMSLVEPHSLTLSEAVRLSLEQLKYIQI